ncbi:MAG: hypothetical protein NTZ17_09625 [Phycisphaerae bacterium]|nr:hypothetical protein [Phycisphaerae bacterium]
MDDDKLICFEYTTRETGYIEGYLKRTFHDTYYRQNAHRIQQVVLVSNRTVEENLKSTCSGLAKTCLQCVCRTLDRQDLVVLLSDYPHLINQLLDVGWRPKWFKSPEDAVHELNSARLVFPSLADLCEGRVYADEELLGTVVRRVCEHDGPTLLTGRWGSGKTVFALATALKLQKERGFTAYYLDLGECIGRHQQKLTSELFNESLKPFYNPEVVFVIDNAHVFPHVAYRIAEWASREKANVLLVSRPISREMCDEGQDFLEFFRSYGLKRVAEEDDSIEDDANAPESHSSFLVHPTMAIIRWLVDRRLKEVGESREYTDREVASLYTRLGHNLTLLVLHLRNWSPRSGDIWEPNLEPVFRKLRKRFCLDKFPEIYLLSALNHFDCSADTNVVFQSTESRVRFESDFFSEGGQATGLLFQRKTLLFGINPGEARLICEAGLLAKERSLQDEKGRLPHSISEMLRTLVTRYASCKPANPYEMLRALRWAAVEAKESGDADEEEEIVETLVSVLGCAQFAEYLREIILPQKLSMLGLGNIARLCRYVRLPPPFSSEDTVA